MITYRLCTHLNRKSKRPLKLLHPLYYIDLSLSVTDGPLSTKLYNRRDDFDFRIVNFPYIYSNIPEPPTYGVLSRNF